MSAFKRLVKTIFYRTGTLALYDRLHYRLLMQKYAAKNSQFRNEHPGFALPPDYYLYETFKPDYRHYRDDGALSAREFLAWTQPYVPSPKAALEWGCGVARIIRHLPDFVSSGTQLTGADINEAMVAWDAAHIPGIRFVQTGYEPPLPFADASFDLVYALSVFTHIEYQYQQGWLQEMARVLQPGGVFLFTTHGRKYRALLTTGELRELDTTGHFTRIYRQQGHRMMGTYNTEADFRNLLPPELELKAFYDGLDHPEKVGGQDLWIVQKKHP